MTPLRLSHIWYRRLYVALFVMSLGYGALYVAGFLTTLSVIGAGIVAVASVALFIFAKKITSFIPTFAVFALFGLVTVFTVEDVGTSSSLFLAPWALVVFIAPIFGAYGWLPVLVVIGSYLAGEYLSASALSYEVAVNIGLSTVLPLTLGLIAWRLSWGKENIEQISNVKILANQLSEVATKSEVIINAIGDGVIAVDGKGVVQLINPAAQEMLGWGKQDALMLNYKSILKLSDDTSVELDASKDPIQEVLNTNQQARGNRITTTTNSGKKIGIALVASPIGDPGAGAIAVFRDVTSERAEEREQAEFISTASHEMRTPVASIEGYLGLALNENTATVDERARDFILKAHESAQHLGRLFQDLLDVSKSEDGRMQNIPRVIDIVPFTETVVQGLQQKATDKGLGLVFVPGGSGSLRKIMPVYYVNLDNDHIREVLDNLIENAIKYTPQGEVRVDVSGSEDKVIISVKDTGLGIPPEDIPHLFQKFYRVDNVDRQSIGGTGLGLYLSRRLIEAMQGRMWVESEFGSGSTFFVELPRLDSKEAEQLNATQTQQTALLASQPTPTAVPAPTPATQIPVTIADTPAPTPAPQPTQIPPTPAAPAVQPTAPQPHTPATRAATTVPRGESLSRDQINDRVRQLEELAKQQRTLPPTR